MRTAREWLRDNRLSVIFFALFLACISAQSLTGLPSYNETLAVHRRPQIGYLDYLGTGNFLSGVFSNWQAAILQLA